MAKQKNAVFKPTIGSLTESGGVLNLLNIAQVAQNNSSHSKLPACNSLFITPEIIVAENKIILDAIKNKKENSQAINSNDKSNSGSNHEYNKENPELISQRITQETIQKNRQENPATLIAHNLINIKSLFSAPGNAKSWAEFVGGKGGVSRNAIAWKDSVARAA